MIIQVPILLCTFTMIALVKALLPFLSTVIGATHVCRFYAHKDEDNLIIIAILHSWNYTVHNNIRPLVFRTMERKSDPKRCKCNKIFTHSVL